MVRSEHSPTLPGSAVWPPPPSGRNGLARAALGERHPCGFRDVSSATLGPPRVAIASAPAPVSSKTDRRHDQADHLSVVPCRPLGAPRGEKAVRSNPASLPRPERVVNAKRSTAPQVGPAAQRGRTCARRAVRESTSAAEGLPLGVEAPAPTVPRSALPSGRNMRGSPRAGFCGLAVPSRQPRAPARQRVRRWAGARIACPGEPAGGDRVRVKPACGDTGSRSSASRPWPPSPPPAWPRKHPSAGLITRSCQES
jgi:hypothetical protein